MLAGRPRKWLLRSSFSFLNCGCIPDATLFLLLACKRHVSNPHDFDNRVEALLGNSTNAVQLVWFIWWYLSMIRAHAGYWQSSNCLWFASLDIWQVSGAKASLIREEVFPHFQNWNFIHCIPHAASCSLSDPLHHTWCGHPLRSVPPTSPFLSILSCYVFCSFCSAA